MGKNIRLPTRPWLARFFIGLPVCIYYFHIIIILIGFKGLEWWLRAVKFFLIESGAVYIDPETSVKSYLKVFALKSLMNMQLKTLVIMSWCHKELKELILASCRRQDVRILVTSFYRKKTFVDFSTPPKSFWSDPSNNFGDCLRICWDQSPIGLS